MPSSFLLLVPNTSAFWRPGAVILLLLLLGAVILYCYVIIIIIIINIMILLHQKQNFVWDYIAMAMENVNKADLEI